MLEQRAQENGELEYRVKEPPAYDGIYSDQLLEVPKHVSRIVLLIRKLKRLFMLYGIVQTQ